MLNLTPQRKVEDGDDDGDEREGGDEIKQAAGANMADDVDIGGAIFRK